MSDELRTPLVEAFERFTADLVVENYGDPHVAFVVLVHPDRHPTIVTISGRGAHDMAHLVCRDDAAFDETATDEPKGRLFNHGDFQEVDAAISHAENAWRGYGYRRDQSVPLGRHIDEEVRSRWQYARDKAMDAAMERAAFEESHQAECPNCSRRFTERGLTQHQSRSQWTGCRTGAPETKRPRPPQPVACPLRCGWTGLTDARPDHLETAHAGQYVVG